jgi:hypothetical protein
MNCWFGKYDLALFFKMQKTLQWINKHLSKICNKLLTDHLLSILDANTMLWRAWSLTGQQTSLP